MIEMSQANEFIIVDGSHGRVAIRPDEVQALSECDFMGDNDTRVLCRVWLKGRQDAQPILAAFNALLPYVAQYSTKKKA